MAETLLSSGPTERSGGDSYQVIVHIDAAALGADGSSGTDQSARATEDAEGACQLDNGPAASEKARRLACDASVVRILERDGRCPSDAAPGACQPR